VRRIELRESIRRSSADKGRIRGLFGDSVQKAIQWAVLSVVLAGIGPVLVRDSPVDPAATAFWRLSLGLPVALLLVRRSILLPWRAMLGAALAGLALAGDLVLWNSALLRTTILEATILVMLYPFIVAPVSYFLYREKVTPRLAIGGGVAFLGLLLMVTSAGRSGHSSAIGDLMAVGAAFFYATSLLLAAPLCRTYNTLAISFWTIFWGAAGALPFALSEGRFIPTAFADWLYVGFYAALTLTSYSIFNHALKTIPTALASILGYGQPVVATVLGFFILHEAPSWAGIVGSVVIAAGLMVATRMPASVEKPPPAG
jgi:drug/metabolite transporter (DMT)-like permease